MIFEEEIFRFDLKPIKEPYYKTYLEHAQTAKSSSKLLSLHSKIRNGSYNVILINKQKQNNGSQNKNKAKRL